MINIELVCDKVVSLVKETGIFICNERRNSTSLQTKEKSKNDFVTYYDTLTEAMLVKGLSEIIPEAGFITEEETATHIGRTFNWIVDPIDGTTNFIHNLPPYCISVALQRNEEIVLGVIYEMTADEIFYAYEGSDAFLNGQVIKVSEIATLQDSLIATGFSLSDYADKQQFFDALLFFSKNTHGLRRIGSAAANLAYVACGRLDGFYKLRLKPWDVAAGALLIKQAGGIISDFKNQDNYLFGEELIASNGRIHGQLLNAIKCSFQYE